MSEGPFPFAREAHDLDQLMEGLGPQGWAFFERQFAPAALPDNFDPGDDMKMVLAAFFRTVDGRRIVDWLLDLTVRAPYPHVGSSRDAAWLAAAKHEARAGVGMVLLKAIAEGDKLFEKRRKPTKEPKP